MFSAPPPTVMVLVLAHDLPGGAEASVPSKLSTTVLPPPPPPPPVASSGSNRIQSKCDSGVRRRLVGQRRRTDLRVAGERAQRRRRPTGMNVSPSNE